VCATCGAGPKKWNAEPIDTIAAMDAIGNRQDARIHFIGLRSYRLVLSVRNSWQNPVEASSREEMRESRANRALMVRVAPRGPVYNMHFGKPQPPIY
jgi:hypothetical protein